MSIIVWGIKPEHRPLKYAAMLWGSLSAWLFEAIVLGFSNDVGDVFQTGVHVILSLFLGIFLVTLFTLSGIVGWAWTTAAGIGIYYLFGVVFMLYKKWWG